MPELPEVEVLVRHLEPLVVGRIIRSIEVRRAKSVRPDSPAAFVRALVGAQIVSCSRRAKYLVFRLNRPARGGELILCGHLGMTGRMYVEPVDLLLPKHAAVIIGFGRLRLVFEDTRYFGRLSLGERVLEGLGPEPLDRRFTAKVLADSLASSRQAIKVRLLDQGVVAGVGNIYASEILFRARVSPRKPSGRLSPKEVRRVWQAMRGILREAIRAGSTLPLIRSEDKSAAGLFYHAAAAGAGNSYTGRLQVYDRAGDPCWVCRTPIRRLVQGGRSTYYCPACQRL